MYLSRLHISKFRVFDDITLYFKNGINILIGENNSGKTAIIDALRICLGCGKPDNFIYVQDVLRSPAMTSKRSGLRGRP